ncbi:dynamin family protein [Ornithinimicrobium sediminis]|uniref:dynamin family protein n=1 Tax=Ornithinimicrobium sediminis TaxID=2904603 RepID=UPI001E4F5297|nr:dynamin family protein [Ornithinimicrobium sediminis]MCE0485404.1 ABC transporter [Ornithinimicrobium sediminis]
MALLTAVERLRAATETVRLPLDLPDAEGAREAQGALVRQLDDYVLPRLRALDAPLLCVVGGSTGAGKSTLVNSVVGDVVTRTGVLRPTTRASVLVHHTEDETWFAGDRILPGLARLTGGPTDKDDPSSVRMVATDALPTGLALLDAPDIDSVVRANRDLARQLLAAADLWLFVTTAARYADAVPWDLLRQAAERGTSVAIVLNRVPPEAMEEVRLHLAQMLREQGLGKSPIFTVPEVELDKVKMLAPQHTSRLSGWLHSLAGDARARSVVIRRTLAGALGSLGVRADELTAAADGQLQARDHLRAVAHTAYRDGLEGVEAGMEDGSLLRGEVLARWQELVGTGEFLRQVEVGIGRLRDRVTAFFTGKEASTEPLGEALQSGASALVTSHAQVAASTAARGWKSSPGGAGLIEAHPHLGKAGPDLQPRVERLIRDWQAEVFQMVRDEAGKRRTTARYLAFGVNGLAVMLMLLAFSATGGLVGAEVAIAGGSAIIAQRLLEAVFGDQAVREMARQARKALLVRVERLLHEEQDRYDGVLDEVPLSRTAVDQVRTAAHDVEAAR